LSLDLSVAYVYITFANTPLVGVSWLQWMPVVLKAFIC